MDEGPFPSPFEFACPACNIDVGIGEAAGVIDGTYVCGECYEMTIEDAAAENDADY